MAIKTRTPTDSNGEGNSRPPLIIRPKPPKLQTSAKAKFEMPAGVAALMEAHTKKHGKGTVHKASSAALDYGRVQSGILVLDLCLGGGFKLSRGSVIFGEKSAGKTSLACLIVKELQHLFPDEICVWVDIETTFDRHWAAILGVDLERLLVVQPNTAEEALDMVCEYVETPGVAGITVDSIAALTPSKEIEASAEDGLMGVQPLMVGRFLRKVTTINGNARKNGLFPLIIYLNQFRMKIGVTFGDPRTLPGGKALAFAATQGVEIKNSVHKIEKGENVGTVRFNEHSIKIDKDKAGGGRITEGKFKMIRDESEGLPLGYIEQTNTIISFATTAGLFTGSGGHYKIDGIPHTFRKHDDISKFFLENPASMRELNDKIIKFYQAKWKIEI